MDVLFGTLRDFGPGFSASFWGLVYRGVLLPMFDDVQHCSALEQTAPPDAGVCFRACVGRRSGAWGLVCVFESEIWGRGLRLRP
jgi:hypothetical protein